MTQANTSIGLASRHAFFTFLLCMIVFLGACGGGSNRIAPLPAAPKVIQDLDAQVVMVGEAAAYAIVASGAGLTYQWQKNGTPIAGATLSKYTTPPTTPADNGAVFQVVVSNQSGSASSQAATLTVHSRVPTDVVTFHNDMERTGQNLNETILTPANVGPLTFGKVGFYVTDGKVDAQPLYLDNVTLPGQGPHNVLYAVTEHDSAYAFDVDTGAQLWNRSLVEPGETSSDSRNCDAITPEIGIAQTPVVDRTRGPHGAIYMIAMSKNVAGEYFQRLHALDLITGEDLFGGPVEIRGSYPGFGIVNYDGQNIFDARQYKERAALLLLNGQIYLTWGSHCDQDPYTSWVMAYSASTLQQTSVIDLTANGNRGSIWTAAGLAADNSGNLYGVTGNGSFEPNLTANGFPADRNYGNGFVKLSSAHGLQVADYFAPYDSWDLSLIDWDFGSTGPLVLPDMTDNSGHVWHLAVAAGKDAKIYVVDRDSMGKFSASMNNNYQEIVGALSAGVWANPAYFNGIVYYNALGDSVKAFPITNARLSDTPTEQTPEGTFAYPGVSPSISANGTSDALLWIVELSSVGGILHVYDATRLSIELYNGSSQMSRDQFGAASKFIPPTVANGKVFLATTTGVAVFGLLP